MWNKKNKALIFVISGPSGSGKTTLAKKILKDPQLKDNFIKPVSYTTRPKRPQEKQGRDYFFVSVKEFQRLLKAKKILEHTRYLGYDYGTSCEGLEQAIKKNLHIILCLDIRGALFVKRMYPDRTTTIFVKPPSLNIARQRILERQALTNPREVKKRIQLASKELNYFNRYDCCLVNDNLSKAVKDVKRIIQWRISR